jgi:hypothetical protein
VSLVRDNLNTHAIGALYVELSPRRGSSTQETLGNLPYTEKGSWLNIAKIELSAFTRQCLNCRVGDLETARRETKHLETDRNA